MSDPQRDQFRTHWIKQVSAGNCPHSGESIRSCKRSDLCDCFDVRQDDPGNDDETLGKFFDEAFPPRPEPSPCPSCGGSGNSRSDEYDEDGDCLRCGGHGRGATAPDFDLPLHRTEAGYPNCSTCDGGGCPDCTDPA